mmetsp:Transcript_63075/g.182882  ORF Transcript_63075/g.182882 Transcript_63075/m.182882 type:complete len:209 (+) Transcript_63075:1627-2253(+)
MRLAGIRGLNSIVKKRRKFACGLMPYNFFSNSVSHLIAKCTFFNKTHVPALDPATIALSAMLKPSSEPIAAEARDFPVEAAKSFTLPLGSKPGALTIMIGEVALLSFSTTSASLKLGRSMKPVPSNVSTKRTPTNTKRSGRRAFTIKRSCKTLLPSEQSSLRHVSGKTFSGSRCAMKADQLPSLARMSPTKPAKHGSKCNSCNALSCC